MLTSRSYKSLIQALGCLSILPSAAAQSFQYVFSDSLPGTVLTSACSAALTSNILCDPWVSHFREGSYYNPAGLKSVCTTSCQTAIKKYQSGLASNCKGLTYNFTETTYLPIDSIGSMLAYVYSLTCLQDSGRFCNYVAYQASLQADVNASTPLGRPDNTKPISPCDNCFVKQLQLEAGSPFAGGDELVTSYSALTSSCKVTSMPIATTTLSSSTVSVTPTTTPTCSGKTYKVSPSDTCRSIAQSQGISVGWLVSDNSLNAYCAEFKATGSLCIQNTCKTYTIKAGDTCSTIAKAHNVTSSQIISWNPILDLTCNNIGVSINDPICIGKPGVPYASPTVTIPVATSFTTAVPAPTDIATNTTTKCGEFYQIQKGDYCNLVCLRFNINLNDFRFLNPAVNVNCTNLFALESYCVAPVGDLINYPGYSGYVAPNNATTSSAWSSAPKATYTPPVLNITDNTPLANGTRSDCWSYTNGGRLQIPINGTFYSSTCELVSSTYGVPLDQLQDWNPSLDTASPNCAFQAGVRYCLLAYNPTTTTTTTPTQTVISDMIRPGTWTNCTAYFEVNFGRSCQSVLDYFGLTIAQFSKWNPEVGMQCENLWQNYSYCVSLTLTLDQAAGAGQADGGVTSTTTTKSTPTSAKGTTSSTSKKTTTTSSKSTTTSSSTNPAIPSPTQPNSIAKNCNKYKITADGDYCSKFAQNNEITVDQLAKWNTVLGAAGANCDTQFWLKYYYCVGVA